jgi:hypothetical protein
MTAARRSPRPSPERVGVQAAEEQRGVGDRITKPAPRSRRAVHGSATDAFKASVARADDPHIDRGKNRSCNQDADCRPESRRA